MTYRPVPALEVFAWGRRVGALALNPATGWFAFQYDPVWVASGVELAPLHMPLRTAPFEFPGLSADTFRRLPPAIADALPDRFGNALIDRWMAIEGIDPGQFSVLDRLAYVADRAMGALEFRPPITRDAPAASAVQMADLVLAARAAFDGSGDNAVDRDALEQLIVVGSSAGGARPKALVAFNPATFQIRSAWRPLEAGFEHWLFKLDGVGGAALDGHSVSLGGGMAFGRIEYAYSQMALAAGITMTECRLLDEGPRRHFVTRRFDRGPAGEKYHIISLCGLAHLDFNLIGAHGYDQYLQTVRLLGLGPDELAEAFRRMVFNVAAANNDDHTRNLSFLRRPDSAWKLAPAYDVTFAHDSTNQWLRQHLMDVNGKVADITAADLHAVGERHDVPGYRRIVREVVAAVRHWPEFAAAAGVPDADTARITGVLDEVRPSP